MEARQALVERMIGLIDRKQFGALGTVLAEDCMFAHPAATVQGPEAIGHFLQHMGAAFSTPRHELTSVVTAGDVVTVEGVWHGTQDGPMITPQGELPPSGAAVTVPFAAVARIRDDRIGSVHVYTDQLSFMGQLGLLPAAA